MKLLEQYDDALRAKNYTIKTRKTYKIKFELFIRWMKSDAHSKLTVVAGPRTVIIQ